MLGLAAACGNGVRQHGTPPPLVEAEKPSGRQG
jgi:hypothetical protein